MSGPGGRGHQVAVHVGAVQSLAGRHPPATGLIQVRLDRRIRTASSSLQNAGGGQQLGTVADGRDRLAGRGKMLHDFQHPRVQPQIFGRPTPRHDQGVIRVGLDLVEGRIQPEIVSPLFAVGLLALKIVDRRHHALPRRLARADRIHLMAGQQQHLKRHHRLVVFHKITDQHQNLLGSHGDGPG